MDLAWVRRLRSDASGRRLSSDRPETARGHRGAPAQGLFAEIHRVETGTDSILVRTVSVNTVMKTIRLSAKRGTTLSGPLPVPRNHINSLRPARILQL